MGLLHWVPRLEAQEEIEALRWRPDLRLEVDAYLALARRATGNEDEAQRMATRYAAKLMHEDAARARPAPD